MTRAERTTGETGTARSTPRVLVTRPAEQAAAFGEALEALGAVPVFLPCLAIEPIASDVGLTVDVPADGLAVFTSPNAVRHAPGLPWHGVRALAIGPATERALRAVGQDVLAPPAPPYTGEALLAQLAALPAAVRADGLSLVTGEGGRELLPRALPAALPAGAPFRRFEVYRRTDAAVDAATLAAAFAPLPALIVTTSDRSLDRLLALAERLDREAGPTGSADGPAVEATDRAATLRARALVVNSVRAEAHARSRGFVGPVYAARSAGDDGQLEQVRAWLERGDSDS